MLLWVALECTPYRRFVVDLYLSDAKNLWTVEVPKILNFLYGNAKGKLTSKDFFSFKQSHTLSKRNNTRHTHTQDYWYFVQVTTKPKNNKTISTQSVSSIRYGRWLFSQMIIIVSSILMIGYILPIYLFDFIINRKFDYILHHLIQKYSI